jgi:hypothetical protein
VEFEDGKINHLPCGAIQMLGSDVIEEGNDNIENEEFEFPCSSSSECSTDASDDEDINYLMDHEGDVPHHTKPARKRLRVVGLEKKQGRGMLQVSHWKQADTTMGTSHAKVAQIAEVEPSIKQSRSCFSTFSRYRIHSLLPLYMIYFSLNTLFHNLETKVF